MPCKHLKEQPSVRHNPVLPGHIYIRAPLKVLKQSSFPMQTRIISEANNIGQQTTRDQLCHH